MKFTKAQIWSCLIGGSVVGVLYSRQPYRTLIDPFADALSGMIFFALVILIAKGVKQGWIAMFRRNPA